MACLKSEVGMSVRPLSLNGEDELILVERPHLIRAQCAAKGHKDPSCFCILAIYLVLKKKKLFTL